MENYECPICGKIFTSENYIRPKTSYTKHLLFCEFRKKVLDYLKISRSDLPKILESYGSVSEMYRLLSPIVGGNLSKFFKIFKEDNISTTISKANSSEIIKNKRKNTNLERYGFEHNFCKEHPSRKKWENRLLEEEGITNVFQRESVKEKSKRKMIEKYGVEHAAQCEAFLVTELYMINKYGEEQGKKAWKELCYSKGKSMRLDYYIEKYGKEKGTELYSNRIKNLNNHYSQNNSKISYLNIKFLKLLDSLNIEYEMEFCLWLDDISPRYYDFKIGNTIIELNGDFWHANPKIYSESDILNFPGGSKLAKDIWNKDLEKKKLALNNGYKIYYFWEDQINNSQFWKKVVKFFKNYANNKNKINKKNS